MSRITVLLVEDHLIVREGLRALLGLESDIEVVGEAGDGRAALELTRKLKPDVVVMDIALPKLNGVDATSQILHEFPNTKALILSAHSDDAYVEKVMDIGASGYLIKQSAAHVLPEAIRRVHRGKTVFSRVISKRRKQRNESGDAPGSKQSKKDPGKLTSREAEVLQLIAEGYANKQTADVLHISIKTVEKHRQSLMNKLNIHDTAGLTRHAIAEGIIESSVQVTII
ncbi:MAG: DNA-binding NarL/FixJ family response regulator [Verrucomicrobiales bacterium]|jgi:DNA-binding NarL/FixJ family response regulator